MINPFTGTQYSASGNPFEIRYINNQPYAVNVADPTKEGVTMLGDFDSRVTAYTPAGTKIRAYSPVDMPLTFDKDGNFANGKLLFRVDRPGYLYDPNDVNTGRAPPESAGWIDFMNGA